ncbi:MAG: hypothetical protein IJ952_06620 [Alistipes sp.]|nr:hypothetical protein [Alistipes sp.]
MLWQGGLEWLLRCEFGWALVSEELIRDWLLGVMFWEEGGREIKVWDL